MALDGQGPEHALLLTAANGQEWTLQELGQSLQNEGIYPHIIEKSSHDNFEFNPSMIEKEVEQKIKETAQKIGKPITIIGHSWGGLLAALQQEKYPNLIKKIITIASPVAGIKKPQHVDAESIYSPQDSVVPWLFSRNPSFNKHHSLPFKNHHTMVHDPEVIRIIRESLTQPKLSPQYA